MIMSFINKNKIRAVIFDWGGVCCQEGEPFASKILQERVGKHPNDICQDVMGLYLDFYRGKYTTDEFYTKIIEYYSLKQDQLLNPKEMAQAYIDSTIIWHDVLDIARKLQNNYKVGLLSDLTPIMKEYIHKECSISSYFPVEIYSCDKGVNAVKTDGPKIFKIMMKIIDIELPKDYLIIDNSKNKLAQAAKLGIQTMLFRDKESFLEEIKSFL